MVARSMIYFAYAIYTGVVQTISLWLLWVIKATNASYIMLLKRCKLLATANSLFAFHQEKQ